MRVGRSKVQRKFFMIVGFVIANIKQKKVNVYQKKDQCKVKITEKNN